MRASFAAPLAAFLLPLAACALAAQQPTPPPTPMSTHLPQVVTTGTGEVRVTPDRATINIAVETRAPTAAAAGAENAKRQQATLDALRKAGIAKEHLSTVDYSVSPDYQYDREGNKPPTVVGYVVRNTIRAEVRKLDDLGRIIDAALAAGANTIGAVEFTASNIDAARQQALANAVASARTQAEAMAKAAGGGIGRLLELNSQAYSRPPIPIMEMAAMRSAAKDVAETPINPGEFVVTAMVTGRWEFK
jgi:uncharacterized protein YggE